MMAPQGCHAPATVATGAAAAQPGEARNRRNDDGDCAGQYVYFVYVVAAAAAQLIIVHIGIIQAEGDAANNNGHREDHQLSKDLSPMIARYVYTVMFSLGNIFAWAVRNNHISTFFRRQRLSGCDGNRDCLATEAILIISLAYFLFHSSMFLSTAYTKKVHDRRNVWHSQWWPAKILLFAIFFVMSTMEPSYVIQFYGKVAPFGAGIFICVQLISVIRYITRLNYKWCITNMEERYLWVIVVSILGYIGSMVGTILMGLWYAGCWQNITFIVTTMLLVYLMSLVSMITKAKGFYMEPALLGVYIVFLCYSAIKSEPETGCYKKEKGSSAENWKIISFIVGLISISVAAFSTGKDYKCLRFRNVALSENDVPYGYGFFHFVFATGSMYFGMMFVGWDTHHASGEWSMDAGWTSTWVHVANEGLVVISFLSILLARIYGIDWLRETLEGTFGTGGRQGGESRTTELEMNTGSPPSPLSQATDHQISVSINISALSSNDNTEPSPLPSLSQTESEITVEE